MADQVFTSVRNALYFERRKALEAAGESNEHD